MIIFSSLDIQTKFMVRERQRDQSSFLFHRYFPNIILERIKVGSAMLFNIYLNFSAKFYTRL